MRGGSKLTEDVIFESDCCSVTGDDDDGDDDAGVVVDVVCWGSPSLELDCGFSRLEKSTAEAGGGM